MLFFSETRRKINWIGCTVEQGCKGINPRPNFQSPSPLCIRKKYLKWKIPIWIALILKSLKTRFWSTSNSATEWSEQKIFPTKIFTVKNCPRSEIFKLTGPFYQVPIFCSGGLHIAESAQYFKIPPLWWSYLFIRSLFI